MHGNVERRVIILYISEVWEWHHYVFLSCIHGTRSGATSPGTPCTRTGRMPCSLLASLQAPYCLSEPSNRSGRGRVDRDDGAEAAVGIMTLDDLLHTLVPVSR